MSIAPSSTAPGVEPYPAEQKCLVDVYVWELPVRLAHWTIVLSMVVLSVTGIYIGKPFLIVAGEARYLFMIGLMKAIHFWAAFVFMAAVIMRIVWMFTGNKYSHWDKFLPVHRVRRLGILPTIRFYMFGQRKPPGFIGHNPLAGIAYTVVFLLFTSQILTGLALYAISASVDSPIRMFAALLPIMGGAQQAHFIHHIIMWLLWGFGAHHFWSSVLMSTEEANATVESIFSGHKFVPPEDLVYSGYRFMPREEIPEELHDEMDRFEP